MIKIIRVTLILLVIQLFACKPAQKEICEEDFPSEFVLDKIVATWKNEDGIHFERWRKTDSRHYTSDVYRLNREDTTFLEKAKIYYLKKNWNFENWVKDQNNNKNVVFTSEMWDGSQISFKNPAHDFPTEIRYLVVSDSILQATIFGKNDQGKQDSFQFNYERLN
jgi:hypothetical protein